MSYANNIHRQLEDQVQFFEETFKGQSIEHCSTRPGPGAWSALDCIAHLNLTLDVTCDEIDRKVNRAIEKGQKPNEIYKPGFLGQRFARLLAPKEGDVKRRIKTTKRYSPEHSNESGQAILQGFRDRMERVKNQVEASKKVSLNRCRINSNVTPLIKFKLGDTFHIVLAHNERHIFQARKALQLT